MSRTHQLVYTITRERDMDKPCYLMFDGQRVWATVSSRRVVHDKVVKIFKPGDKRDKHSVNAIIRKILSQGSNVAYSRALTVSALAGKGKTVWVMFEAGKFSHTTLPENVDSHSLIGTYMGGASFEEIHEDLLFVLED
jgi:hypothetical protein